MPYVNKLFGGVIETGRQALNVRMARQGLIQSNIANIETPGYTVKDFSFAAVMENLRLGRGRLAVTNDKHIRLDPVDVSESLEFSRERRPVDLDEEMAKLSENQLMYQVAAKIMAKKFEGMQFAIDEGGK